MPYHSLIRKFLACISADTVLRQLKREAERDRWEPDGQYISWIDSHSLASSIIEHLDPEDRRLDGSINLYSLKDAVSGKVDRLLAKLTADYPRGKVDLTQRGRTILYHYRTSEFQAEMEAEEDSRQVRKTSFTRLSVLLNLKDAQHDNSQYRRISLTFDDFHRLACAAVRAEKQ